MIIKNQKNEIENLWKEIFDTINDAITIHDMDFNILHANKAAIDLFGENFETVLSQKCFKTYHGLNCPPEKCPSCCSLKTGKPSVTELFESNIGKFIEIKAIPRIKNNSTIGIIHVVRDISEQKENEKLQIELKDKLIQSQKMESVGRLAGGIAHDFNNILMVILGYSNPLFIDSDSRDELIKKLEIINESSEKAAGLIRQLLAFSRKQIMEMKLCDINIIISGVIKMLSRLIGDNIIIKYNSIEPISNILADKGQIEQIFMNLTVNARDAMPDGGVFIIETSQVYLSEKDIEFNEMMYGNYVKILISDNGTGMTKEVVSKIFEPFYTTKKINKGTGLGLATVYGIVKQHDGFIKVNSEPGEGTTFEIFFPVTEESGSVESEKKISSEIIGGNEKILLVEDDDKVRSLIISILVDSGYEVVDYSNGKDALINVRLNINTFDLVLTDVIMPQMSGSDLVTQIRNIRDDIKIVFISGYDDNLLAHHKIKESGIKQITKPVSPIVLLQKIREVLDS